MTVWYSLSMYLYCRFWCWIRKYQSPMLYAKGKFYIQFVSGSLNLFLSFNDSCFPRRHGEKKEESICAAYSFPNSSKCCFANGVWPNLTTNASSDCLRLSYQACFIRPSCWSSQSCIPNKLYLTRQSSYSETTYFANQAWFISPSCYPTRLVLSDARQSYRGKIFLLKRK